MTTDSVNTRELILEILLEVTERGQYSHLVIRSVLEKYQYLDKRERAFLTRVAEGTIQRQIELDYILDQFSKVKVRKMKPVIRAILRMGVYQLKYMDSVPASAACNEAVKLAKKKGFGQLSGFVNGVLRGVSRGLDQLTYPKESVDAVKAWSVRYSMPEWIVAQWIGDYGKERTKEILAASLLEAPITVRANLERITPEALAERFKEEGVTAVPLDTEKYPGLSYAYTIFGFDHLNGLSSFKEGLFYVQDISSMMVAEYAAPKEGDHCIDVCAAPGGKTLAVAERMNNTGKIYASDIYKRKLNIIEAEAKRLGIKNIETKAWDATRIDSSMVQKADRVLVDVPCSGLGVVRKKPEIKYKKRTEEIDLLPRKQLEILSASAEYVKPGGIIIYSTCTINPYENQRVIASFLKKNTKFKKEEAVQLLPNINGTDGFFICKMRKDDI